MSESFGEEVNRRRRALDPKVGQEALASLADVSRNTISNLERGAVDHTKFTELRIRKALDQLENGSGRPLPLVSKDIKFAIEERTRDEIARQIEAQLNAYPESVFPEGSDSPEGRYIAAMRHAYRTAARIARGEDE